MNIEEMKIVQAIGIGATTLIGVLKNNYPLKHGNCFSVYDIENHQYRIVNFFLENLEHLMEENIVNYPIKIKLLSDRHAVIHDCRIPNNYYRNRFCSVCCPLSLLPITQKLERERDIESGKITIYGNGIESYTVGE